jgi:hypothetical protein
VQEVLDNIAKTPLESELDIKLVTVPYFELDLLWKRKHAFYTVDTIGLYRVFLVAVDQIRFVRPTSFMPGSCKCRLLFRKDMGWTSKLRSFMYQIRYFPRTRMVYHQNNLSLHAWLVPRAPV